MASDMSISKLTLTETFRHAVDGMFVIGRDRKVVYFSEGCERITGVTSTSVLGADCACHKLTDCHDTDGRSLSGVLCPAIRVFEGAAAGARHQISVRHREGRRVWVETTYSPIRNERGDVTAVACIMRDITEAKERESKTQYAAGTAGADNTALVAEGTASIGGPLDRMLTAIERKEILTALDRADGQRTLAARTLGISRSRLYRRMEALRIDPRGVNPS